MKGSTALLVLGMHRSGTSATSGALAHVGFDLGGRLVAAAEDNPKGYFEHEPVVAIHERFLEATGRRWCDPSAWPDGAWQGEPAELARRAIADALAQDFPASPRWALKDPRLSRLLPLWAPLWPTWGVSPRAIVVVRRPVEVAASLARRDGFPELLSDLLWIRHTLDALHGTRELPRACIEYSRLVADPVGTLSTALGRLGIELPASPAPGLDGFVDAGMNHHATARRAGDHPVAVLADEIFAACAGHPDGPGETALDRFRERLDGLAVALDPVLDAGIAAFREVVAQSAQWREEVYSTRSALHAQVRWSDAAAADLERTRHEAAEGRLALEEETRRLEAAMRDVALLESLLRTREAERDVVTEQRDAVTEQREQLRRELDALLGSRSWRWTAPLRRLSVFLSRISR